MHLRNTNPGMLLESPLLGRGEESICFATGRETRPRGEVHQETQEEAVKVEMETDEEHVGYVFFTE